MMKITLKSIKHCLRMKFFLADVNHRRCSLLRAGILGVLFALVIYYFSRELNNKTLQSSITILALGLPTFYILWKFRTHDVQRQIDKVQKQIAKTEENTNNSTFFECARMLTEVKSAEGKPTKYDSLSKKIALEQLVYLKIEIGFDKKRIDSLTRGLDLGGKNFNLARFSGLDLSKADLSGANLSGADLSRADLSEAKLKFVADLSRAKLSEAILIDAELSEANLTGAKLDGAELTGADLTRANLTGAELNGADLTRADLTRADLTRAKLDDANLARAKLNEANLSETDLTGANLTGANLTGANLTGANLSETDLAGADLSRAKLDGAELNGAKLNGAELNGAKLNGAKLNGAELNGAKLNGAIYDDETEFIGTILDSKETRDKEGMIYRPDELI